MTDYLVRAFYEPKLDERREKRINAALDRCNVNLLSEVEWFTYEGGATQLEINIDRDRANRVASELRACGMVVSVGTLAAA